jgi:YHS domain-containing protein
MQAKARRPKRAHVVWSALWLGLVASPASAGLPDGLPGLPQIGERMLVNRVSGIALGGYDAVAYQVAGQALAGLAEHEAVWAGVTWRFSSHANKAAFLADPEGYAPVFDGYDPLGVALSRAVETDPYFFVVRQGRLFLFRTENSRSRFLEDAGLMQRAAQLWPDVMRQLSR